MIRMSLKTGIRHDENIVKTANHAKGSGVVSAPDSRRRKGRDVEDHVLINLSLSNRMQRLKHASKSPVPFAPAEMA